MPYWKDEKKTYLKTLTLSEDGLEVEGALYMSLPVFTDVSNETVRIKFDYADVSLGKVMGGFTVSRNEMESYPDLIETLMLSIQKTVESGTFNTESEFIDYAFNL